MAEADFSIMEPKTIPIDVRPLFRPLEREFIALLDQLNDSDWDKQTVASRWKVKDVVSHLLDGNLRVLSMQRDKYFGETPPDIDGYQQLVEWLNQLNADWVKASRRLSPSVLMLLHRTTGPLVCDYYESLDLQGEAIFSVDWAGESKSLNWMHLAREYTEKWLHQQQIREAAGIEGIMSRTFFHPCMDTFFQALPHTFRAVIAPPGTIVQVTITSEAGGNWFIERKHDGWSLVSELDGRPISTVVIPAHIAWPLFSKSIRPHQIRNEVQIDGDIALGEKVLEMISVMA